MKVTSIAAIAGLAATAYAAPTDHIRRAGELGHQVKAPLNARQAYGTGILPTGTAVVPTGVPLPTGTTSCPMDGALVCNGPNLFGLCNFGSVIFQPVAAGTACQDGQIVGVGIYAPDYVPGGPSPTGTYKH